MNREEFTEGPQENDIVRFELSNDTRSFLYQVAMELDGKLSRRLPERNKMVLKAQSLLKSITGLQMGSDEFAPPQGLIRREANEFLPFLLQSLHKSDRPGATFLSDAIGEVPGDAKAAMVELGEECAKHDISTKSTKGTEEKKKGIFF